MESENSGEQINLGDSQSETALSNLTRRQAVSMMAGAVASLAAGSNRARGDSRKPLNILLLMCDQYRPDALSKFGDANALTSNLDSLASAGVSFRQTYCQVPICVGSRNCLLTGRYAHSTGVVTNGCLANPDQVSFAQHLRSKGYLTACFGKLHTPGREKQDWEILNSDGKDAAGDLRTDDQRLLPMFFHTDGKLPLGSPYPLDEKDTQEWRAAEDTINFLSEKHDRPWLVQCSLIKPHPPFQPPRKYWDMVDRSKLQVSGHKYPADDLAHGNPRYWKPMQRRGLDHLTDDQILDAMQGYYGSIAFDNNLFGKVLHQLDASGQQNNTLVIFTADHGEMLDDHRLWTKMVFFDSSVRIPLIMHLPGVIEGGKQTSALVEHIDLFPTMMDVLGLNTPAGVQGKSFIKLAKGQTSHHRDVVHSEFPNVPMYKPDGSYNPSIMRFDGRYKIVDNGDAIAPELYDLNTDHLETQNLAIEPAYKDRTHTMLAELREWAKQDMVPVHPVMRAGPGQDLS
jgi:choline-sulfatase